MPLAAKLKRTITDLTGATLVQLPSGGLALQGTLSDERYVQIISKHSLIYTVSFNDKNVMLITIEFGLEDLGYGIQQTDRHKLLIRSFFKGIAELAPTRLLCESCPDKLLAEEHFVVGVAQYASKQCPLNLGVTQAAHNIRKIKVDSRCTPIGILSNSLGISFGLPAWEFRKALGMNIEAKRNTSLLKVLNTHLLDRDIDVISNSDIVELMLASFSTLKNTMRVVFKKEDMERDFVTMLCGASDKLNYQDMWIIVRDGALLRGKYELVMIALQHGACVTPATVEDAGGLEQMLIKACFEYIDMHLNFPFSYYYCAEFFDYLFYLGCRFPRNLEQFELFSKHQTLLNKVKLLQTTTHTLKDLTRIAIRESVTTNMVNAVQQMPLPVVLQRFLLLADFEITNVMFSLDEYFDP